MAEYKCSVCGAPAYYDGRCGDGPVLLCKCEEEGGQWVDDGHGGYHTNPRNAHPVPAGPEARR